MRANEAGQKHQQVDANPENDTEIDDEENTAECRHHVWMGWKIKRGFCLTSKMSHDHSRRDSCRLRLYSRWIHSIKLSLARGMTAMVVGSGALLGFHFYHANSVKESVFSSGSLNHATLAPDGERQIPD